MPDSKPSSATTDRLLDIAVQAGITALVMVGVTRLLQKNDQPHSHTQSHTPRREVEYRAPVVAHIPTPRERMESSTSVMTKVSSQNSLHGTAGQREDEREYKIEHNGNFSADATVRSRTWFKHPTW
jgi:hypothetical protein